MSSITAIETRYAGCRFRSRLEARWAVFFNALGLKWEYEPEGIKVPLRECNRTDHASGDCWTATSGDYCSPAYKGYLPDFWLPELRTYVEVKGSDEQAPPEYLAMLANAIDFGATPLKHGLLLLGPIPNPDDATIVYHQHLSHRKGVDMKCVAFRPGPYLVAENLPVYLPSGNTTAPDYPVGISWEPMPIRIGFADGRWWPMLPPVARAYTAARSARFEHGENG